MSRDPGSTPAVSTPPLEFFAPAGEISASLDEARIGLAVLDGELRYVHVNAPLAEMNGVPLDDHIGRTLWDVVPSIADASAHMMRRVLASGVPRTEEVVGTTPADPTHRRHWTVTYRPVTLEGGGQGVAVVVVEISERIEAQAMGEARLNLLDAAEEVAGVGSFISDIDAGVVTVSRGFAQIFGWPGPGDYPAERVFQAIHPEERAESVAAVRRMIAEGGALHTTGRIVRTDGAVRWVDVHAQVRPRRTPESPLRAQNVVIDITERHAAAELMGSLRGRQEALRRITDLIAAGPELSEVFDLIVAEVCALGAPGAAIAAYGHGLGTVVAAAGDVPLVPGDVMRAGRGPLRIAFPETHEPIAAGVEGQTGGDDDPEQLLTPGTITVRGGEWGVLLVSTSARDALTTGLLAGDFARLAAVAIASADARRELHAVNAELEARVALRTRELRATVSELEAFAYTVSHDLRGPLRAIHAAAELLEDGATGSAEAALKMLRLIRESASGMDALIDELLDLARLGTQPLESTAISTDALVDGVIAELRAAAAGPVRITRDHLPDVLGAPGLVRQVLMNLLGNAVKFSRHVQDPCVHVGFGLEDGVPMFRVSDNGVGFPDGRDEAAFELFRRVHDDERFEGTGAGLAIVRRIVERHGGSVWVEPQDGEGATVAFTLPLVDGGD
ncbi:MAG: PAS domain-containing protein [Thermoleophilia bacterium]